MTIREPYADRFISGAAEVLIFGLAALVVWAAMSAFWLTVGLFATALCTFYLRGRGRLDRVGRVAEGALVLAAALLLMPALATCEVVACLAGAARRNRKPPAKGENGGVDGVGRLAPLGPRRPVLKAAAARRFPK